MSDSHDPYRELEQYLAKAQEEIEKALEELHHLEENFQSNHYESLILPPPAFRSSSSHQEPRVENLDTVSRKDENFHKAVSRVCHDGNLIDLKHSSSSKYFYENFQGYRLRKSISSPVSGSFFMKIKNVHQSISDGMSWSARSEGLPQSPLLKQKLKQLRPSFSFPEGSMDTVLREVILARNTEDTHIENNQKCENLKYNTVLPSNAARKIIRERSFSETFVSEVSTDLSDSSYTYPGPPNGDVNLLSIWADNLVLEIDRTLSSELSSPFDSYSPSSDYNLSPVKRDTNFDEGTETQVKSHVPNPSCTSSKEVPDPLSSKTCQSVTFEKSKLMYSPDSSLGYVNSETKNAREDVVDSSCVLSKRLKSEGGPKLVIQNNILQNSFDITDCITPPPPEFEDKISDEKLTRNKPPAFKSDNLSFQSNNNSSYVSNEKENKRDAETQISKKPFLRVASFVSPSQDDTLDYSANSDKVKEIHRHARVIPAMTLEFENCATLTATCVVNEPTWNGTIFNGFQNSSSSDCFISSDSTKETKTYELPISHTSSSTSPVDDYLSESENEDDVFEDAKDVEKRVSSLPKSINYAVTSTQQYSSSLPRDAGRILPSSKKETNGPQRSSSFSAVSSLSQMSVEELEAFMRKVKTSTYLPPPRADVCIDVKADIEESQQEVSNRDAVTQTTPQALSRSSSFTWVTECDCSDLDSFKLRSDSEDSLFQYSYSNCTSEKKTKSSSSVSLSSDEDGGGGGDVPSGSCCSSLYLSACSEASDSSLTHSSTDEKQENAIQISNISSHSKDHILSRGTFKKELLSGPSTLANVPEGKIISETSSLGSSESNNSDNIHEQPASFPPTLKSINKNKTKERGCHQNQPVEANVLVVNELNIKSVSAPVLRHKKKEITKKEDASSSESSPSSKIRADISGSSKNEKNVPPRSQSAKELNELQALEACTWLRAAGFPQYAQMFEDNLFPIDVCTVQKDHSFLHPDSIQSLFRRLNTLNRCAKMKYLDSVPQKSLNLDESDDEDQCALSENWQFQRSSRRWSRVPSPTSVSSECNLSVQDIPSSPKPCRLIPASPIRKFLSPEEAYSSSHDSVFIDEQHSSPDSIRRSTSHSDGRYHHHSLPVRETGGSPGSSSGSGCTLSLGTEELCEKNLDVHQSNLHRSGSDRIKEGAKALLRRMESLKGRRKKKPKDGMKSINILDTPVTTANNGTDGSSCSSLASSPQFSRHCAARDTSPQNVSDCSQAGTPQLKHRKKGWGAFYKREREASAHSDSECPVVLVSELWKDANSNETKLIERYITSQEPFKRKGNSSKENEWSESRHNTKPNTQSPNHTSIKQKNFLHPSSCQNVEENKQVNRVSHYDNFPAPLVVFNNACVESLEKECSDAGKNGSNQLSDCDASDGRDEGEIIIINNERRDSGVGSSLTRKVTNYQAPWHCFVKKTSLPMKLNKAVPVTNLNAPQILVLRKLSLLKLTTLMEKFSPSSRTGWSWGVPKFIRRIRTPDYKDKVVFGVPLLLVLQRTGQPLPVSIQAAIHYLRKTALDSTGLFRKSGVRSRIQKLRNLNESNPDQISYEDQQVYDVADMLKQYFRELPEALLTNKLSETFISIYQYIPEELRLEAIQAAILLMPDENREVLQSLLSFLQEVCQHSGENQMTATNLAVCFAPSLFHLSASGSSSASPRRRKTVGVPDLHELNENRAAYECLTSMVMNYKDLFCISEEAFSQSHLSVMDDCEPASIDQLSTIIDKDTYGWRLYIDCCIQAVLKESKDKYKGWVNVSQSDGVDLAYKKVGDGHPLRLWKVSTEVEAPPVELLNRLLRERNLWDNTFQKWRVVHRLDKQTEVFHYVSSSLPPHPPCDYCIIRSWKTDLAKGSCVLVEVSIDHPEVQVMADSIRATVLASRFLIEPCGSGKSRITHISRIDTRGRSPEWYNRAYGHICTLQLLKLRDSFCHLRTSGPETKV